MSGGCMRKRKECRSKRERRETKEQFFFLFTRETEREEDLGIHVYVLCRLLFVPVASSSSSLD